MVAENSLFQFCKHIGVTISVVTTSYESRDNVWLFLNYSTRNIWNYSFQYYDSLHSILLWLCSASMFTHHTIASFHETTLHNAELFIIVQWTEAVWLELIQETYCCFIVARLSLLSCMRQVLPHLKLLEKKSIYASVDHRVPYVSESCSWNASFWLRDVGQDFVR